MGIIRTGKTQKSISIVTAKDYWNYSQSRNSLEEIAPPEALIISFHPNVTQAFIAHFAFSDSCTKYRKTFLSPDRRLGVCQVGVGAPAAAMMLEEYIAWGVKKFIVIGIAGAISPVLDVADVVLCQGAFRDEGTSYHYLDANELVLSSSSITRLLQEQLEMKKIPFKMGYSWTTDAVYRETSEDVEYFQGKGGLVVEMEMAALFSVSEFYGCMITGIVVVSDLLCRKKWNPQFQNKKLWIVIETVLNTAIEALEKSYV